MTCNFGQGFAKNYNPSYSAGGLIGHTGVDADCGYGTFITSAYSGLAFKVLTKENPANDGSGFTGVFMIIDDGIECFEWLVGHCDPIVSTMDMVKAGEVIGTEANNGKVYSGNSEITLAMQKTGDHRGSHRHYQKRPLIPRHNTEYGKNYLGGQVSSPFYWGERYYEIPHFKNGFNGCIDPLKSPLQRDLFIGCSGYDVFVLQRVLVRNRVLSVEPTGYFGWATYTALRLYQQKRGIISTGYMGTKTRSVVVAELSPVPQII